MIPPSPDIYALLSNLFIDTGASWLRMLIALVLSTIISLVIGIAAARREWLGRIVIPIVDILQTLPILAFFPFVIFIVIASVPGWIGVNAAVIFLIITSMLWNMIFGAYEAVKTMSGEFLDVAKLYRLRFIDRITRIYIPAAMPRLAEQSVLSWAIGLFYLVTSEIFSTGNANYEVTHGIGVDITQLALSGSLTNYFIGLVVFLIFVIATRYIIFAPYERMFDIEGKGMGRPQHLHKLHPHRARLRLFKELHSLHMKARLAHERRIFRRLFKTEPTEAMLEKHADEIARSKMLYRTAGLLILALIIALGFYTGIINGTVISDEWMSLVALAYSFARVWGAFVMILIIAVPLCVYIIFITRKATSYGGLFQVLASIPATVVLPLLVLVLIKYPHGNELVAFSVFFLSGFWYVVFGAIADSRTLQPEIFDIKKLFHVKSLHAWKDIYVKALLPGLITGAVTGIAGEWNASIVAEYFTSTGVGNGQVLTTVGTGIGKLLDTSLGNGDLTLMGIALINLTIMIILINTFVWKRMYNKMEEIYK